MPRSIFYQPASADPNTGDWLRARGETPFDITGLANGTEYRFDDGQGVFLRTPEGVPDNLFLFNQAVGEPDHISGAPAGWEQPWAAVGTITQRTEGFLRVVVDTGNARRMLSRTGLSVSGPDCLTRIRINAFSTSDAFEFGLTNNVAGASGSETANRADILSSNSSVRRGAYNNGAAGTSVFAESGQFPVIPLNQWAYVRMTADGGMRYWIGTPAQEPGNQVSLPLQITSPGAVGLLFFAGGAQVDIEFVSYGVDGNPAPFPA